MRIGVDIDNVLSDYVAAFWGYVELHSGRDIPIPENFDSDRWEFYKDAGLTSSTFIALSNDGVDDGFIYWQGPPAQDAVEVLTRLREAGHTIHIVTHRTFGQNPCGATQTWLNAAGVPYDSLTFSGDKTIVPTDIFIDDNVDNYLALEAAGTVAVLMDHGWNRSLENATRVSSWLEFEKLVSDQVYLNAQRGQMRQFDTGATRNPDTNKYDYEGFLSPLVIREFARYMHGHRVQADGQLRDSDNWQKGIPLDSYMKSLWRHLVDLWMIHRGNMPYTNEQGDMPTAEGSLMAIIFNAQGYAHELLKLEL